jgi:hypothetical protein
MDDVVYTLSGGEISIWVADSGSVMLKVLSEYKDPVELGEGELLELINILIKLHKALLG